jgi:hypothetical protein
MVEFSNDFTKLVAWGAVADRLRSNTHSATAEGVVNTRNYDEWTIDRWRLEPRNVLEFDDSLGVEKSPPLWKDLTLAAVVVLVLWIAAAAVFG